MFRSLYLLLQVLYRLICSTTRVDSQDLFESTSDLVDWTLAGNDSSVLFYGETEAGKSYSMIGEDDWG